MDIRMIDENANKYSLPQTFITITMPELDGKLTAPPVSHMKFSNDGNTIAAFIQGTIYVFGIAPGKCAQQQNKPLFRFHTGAGSQVKQEFCFTPNDKYILRYAGGGRFHSPSSPSSHPSSVFARSLAFFL